MARVEFVMPDLEIELPRVSLWLVDVGQKVNTGDRILEVLADGVTVDLPAPASGVLVEQAVAEDDPLAVGQVLGVIDSEIAPRV